GAERRIDLALHGLQVLERPEVEVASIDERDELAEQHLAELAVAAHRPRLQPHRALPRLAPRLVVRERRGQGDRDRPFRAARTEPEVDAEAEPVGRELTERARGFLGETAEELREGAPGRLLAVVLVDADEVDVRAVVELLAAELPHAEDAEVRRTAL